MLPRPIVTDDGNRTALLSEVSAGFFSMLGIHAQLGQAHNFRRRKICLSL